MFSSIEAPPAQESVPGARLSRRTGRPNGSGPGCSARSVRRQLEKILASPDFDASGRSRELLGFIVEEALAGREENLSQAAIATAVFRRKDDFDPLTDPIVRIQAGRLRRSLERYYLLAGSGDALRIELPKGSYVPAFSAVAAAAGSKAAPPVEGGAEWSARDWPVLDVGAFAASGAALEALAEQVREELALELARYRTLRVVLRTEPGHDTPQPNAARFALAGRIRSVDGEPRLAARLLDRRTGQQAWAEQFRPLSLPGGGAVASADDVPRLIAARVAAEEGVVVQLLAGEMVRQAPLAPTGYGAVLLAYRFFLTRDPNGLAPAVEALRRAVQADPECAPAWTYLARLQLADHAFEITPDPAPIDDAIALAQNGVRVDPTSTIGRCILAAALLVKGELAAGISELEDALRLNPSSLAYLEVAGFLLTLLGDFVRGPALCRSARERNPYALPQGLFGLWFDHLRRGELEQAHQAALEYRDPTFFWRALMRAACLGLLGRIPEAQAEAALILRRKPDFAARGRILIGRYVKFPEVMAPIVAGLARAGLELE